ncbi:hypothetical protein CEXT_506231 [Caerostris extrusa]|uniref:Uncharacterized protein n=1 Tax=Caerostris extrusa TaxID=172846 RepID=A0AAV4XGL8_CAEEX|nr:hypothetical protein CEXT_506231 [Caerostris extrusa]
MNKNILSCSDKTRKSEFKPHSLENECSNNLSHENELINNHSDTDKDVIFLEENKKSNKLCGRKSTRLVPKHKCEEVVDLSDDDSTNMDKNYLGACNKNSLSPIHSEDSGESRS